jgi:hypothetical protein
VCLSKQASQLEQEPLHRKFARESLALLERDGGSGGRIIDQQAEGNLEEVVGRADGIVGGSDQMNEIGLESSAENEDQERSHQEGGQEEDRDSDLDDVRSGRSGALVEEQTGPPGEPIVMYPELFIAWQEYRGTGRVRSAVSCVTSWPYSTASSLIFSSSLKTCLFFSAESAAWKTRTVFCSQSQLTSVVTPLMLLLMNVIVEAAKDCISLACHKPTQSGAALCCRQCCKHLWMTGKSTKIP